MLLLASRIADGDVATWNTPPLWATWSARQPVVVNSHSVTGDKETEEDRHQEIGNPLLERTQRLSLAVRLSTRSTRATRDGGAIRSG